jgi:hypothetical protein
MRLIGVLKNPIKPPKGVNDEHYTHKLIDTALPSWNDGMAKKFVVAFLAVVNQKRQSDFVPLVLRCVLFNRQYLFSACLRCANFKPLYTLLKRTTVKIGACRQGRNVNKCGRWLRSSPN